MKVVFTKAAILCIGSVLTQILYTKTRETLLDDAALALTEITFKIVIPFKDDRLERQFASYAGRK